MEVGFDLWLADNSDIVNGKMRTIFYILTGYGSTPLSFSLSIGRKHSHKNIELAEELSLGLLAGATSKTLPLGLLAGAVAETLKP